MFNTFILLLRFSKILKNICRYGTQRSPWFCLAPSYWLPGSTAPPTSLSTTPVEVSEDVESIPATMRGTEAIVIRDLRKDFTGLGKETVRAVQGVNLDIYPGEITAILGHNGAGHWSYPCITSLPVQESPHCSIC